MSNIRKEVYQFQGCHQQFDHDELALLSKFFHCKSGDDLVKAVQRYEDMLSRRDIELSDCPPVSELILVMASELYIGFASLEKPLKYRYQPKQNGPLRKKKAIPFDILNIMEKEMQSGRWTEKPKQIEVIKWLKKKGVLESDLAATTLEKEIQAIARRSKELVKAFESISMKASKSP